MSSDLVEYYIKKISNLLDKTLIRNPKSSWSFFANKNAKTERRTPWLIIKSLNQATIFSKFDIQSGFGKIQPGKDKYMIAFTMSFCQYNLKNAPSEFQHIMHDIFTIIDNVLVFSEIIYQLWKHLRTFIHIRKNGLVVLVPKNKLFQIEIRILGHNIRNGTIIPIQCSLELVQTFPDNYQLQRFLESLNYISDFYQYLQPICNPLSDSLKTDPPPWIVTHTHAVQQIKQHVHYLPLLHLRHPSVIVKRDASDLGYGDILKQHYDQHYHLVRYHYDIWNPTQAAYSIIKTYFSLIILCIFQYRDHLLKQIFLLHIAYKSAKGVLQKDVKNLAAQQIFARWQAILAIFDFDITMIKGNSNSLLYFFNQKIPSRKTLESAHQSMAQLPLGSQTDQAQGNGLASPQQTARGKDKSNPLDWLEALPKSPVTRNMVVKRSLRDRYQMHDPSVGSYLLAVSPSYQFLADFTTLNPGYIYKAISYQLDPLIHQHMEERRIQIIQNFYPHNSSLPLNIINIVIRVCINKSVNQLCYALHLKEEDNLIIPILLFSKKEQLSEQISYPQQFISPSIRGLSKAKIILQKNSRPSSNPALTILSKEISFIRRNRHLYLQSYHFRGKWHAKDRLLFAFQEKSRNLIPLHTF